MKVKNSSGENILILSQTAFDSLTTAQIEKMGSYDKLLPIAIPTIEAAEGGSVRCMMAEIFLERK
jgi:hypothetical protein